MTIIYLATAIFGSKLVKQTKLVSTKCFYSNLTQLHEEVGQILHLITLPSEKNKIFHFSYMYKRLKKEL